MPYNNWTNSWTPYATYPWNGYQVPTAQMPQQNQQIQQQVQQQPQQQMPIQNGGFVVVPNIDTARNWPVAPGNSVTFKDESAPYIYTKTMGYSQLDAPRFEKYRLMKEEITEEVAQQAVQNAVQERCYAEMADIEALRGQLDTLRKEVTRLSVEIEKPVEAVSARSTKGRKTEAESNE